MAKNKAFNQNTDRIWLEPGKMDTTTVVPEWEGVYNPPPQYMDLALYNLHSIDIKKMSSYYNTHKKYYTLEETMKTFLKYDPDNHIIVWPHNEKDRIVYASSKEIGHVIAYARNTPIKTSTTQLDFGREKRWDMAIIEFENNSVDFFPKGKKERRLTMYDENFTLTKGCEIIELEQLEKILITMLLEENQSNGLMKAQEKTSQKDSELLQS